MKRSKILKRICLMSLGFSIYLFSNFDWSQVRVNEEPFNAYQDLPRQRMLQERMKEVSQAFREGRLQELSSKPEILTTKAPKTRPSKIPSQLDTTQGE